MTLSLDQPESSSTTANPRTNVNHSPKSLNTDLSTYSAPSILLNNNQIQSQPTSMDQQMANSADTGAKNAPNVSNGLLTSSKSNHNAFNDNLSDCWSINSDSGLQMYSTQMYNGYGNNLKMGNANNESSSCNGKYNLKNRK